MATRGTDQLSGDRPVGPPLRSRRRRRAQAVRRVLLFAGIIVGMNALVGERSVLEMQRATRDYDELAASIENLRAENRRLRDEARQLVDNPRAIEAEARRELGMIRPGEILVTVHEAR